MSRSPNLAHSLDNQSSAVVNTDSCINSLLNHPNHPPRIEAIFRTALTNAAIGFAFTTLEGKFIEANPLYCAMSGYTLEELRTMNFSQLIHPEDKAENLLQVKRLLSGDISHFVIQNRCIRKDGELVWVQKSGSVAYDESGKPKWLVAFIEDISARKEAEAKLEQEMRAKEANRAFLSTLLQAAPIGFCFFDLNRRYRMINAQLAEINGIAVEEHIGRTVREIIPALADEIDVLFDRVMRTGEAVPEYLISGETSKTPGVQRHWMASWYPVKDTEGRILGVGVFANEVTEQRQTEEALLAARNAFRQFVEYSPFGVYAIDSNFQMFQVSEGAQKVFDKFEPLLGRDFAEIVRVLWPAPYATETIAHFRHTLETGEPFHATTETEHRRDINATESYDWKIERVTLPDGQLGVVCHFYDLSERQRHEQELNTSEERLRLATSSMNGVVFDWDLETNFVYRSEGLQRLSGYSPEEVPPKPEWWTSLIHPDDMPTLKRHFQEDSPPEFREEYRFLHREGHYVNVVEQGSLIRDAEGKIRRVIGTTLDISEQKRAQAEISDLNQRLQRAVAETHHRVKNNLQILSALVGLQQADDRESVPASSLKRIDQHIHALSTLHDLLTLQSKVAADQDTVSLKSALERLVPVWQITATPRKILLLTEDIRVTLKQSGSFLLLVNELVSNAFKHGKGDVTVTLSSFFDPDLEFESASLEICDDGLGFPVDFDPTKAANTGLELTDSLARWDLKGDISYDNREEGGGRVKVTFPLNKSSDLV